VKSNNKEPFKKPDISLRQAFGDALVYWAKKYNNFVVFDADVASGTGVQIFKNKFPRRFYQFGISEQAMMSAAAGRAAASNGRTIPIVTTFAVFATMRAHEQIRTFIAYPKLKVIIASSHVGLDVGPDGPTAQATEDLATMRAIPNMTVIAPADYNQMIAAFPKLLECKGPVYLRTGRSPAPHVYPQIPSFKIGRADILRKGNDVSIIACGVMVARSLIAAELLEQKGISAEVINVSTIKPLDKKTIIGSSLKTGAVVTAEDHNILGGLGGAVSELLSKNQPTIQEFIGVKDIFAESGDPQHLAKKYKLTSSDISKLAITALKRKFPPKPFTTKNMNHQYKLLKS